MSLSVVSPRSHKYRRFSPFQVLSKVILLRL